MDTILTTIVGSRLHGTFSPDSDYDFRGVFIIPLQEFLSPFTKTKQTNWIEGKDRGEDDTAYELTHFCKMATQGNPSALEVLVGLPYQSTALGRQLQSLLPAFLSQRCIPAFLGYAHNQEKKFRDNTLNRKHKFATALLRTLYQLNHLLQYNELIGTYPPEFVEILRTIKQGEMSDIEIMQRIFEQEERAKILQQDCKLPSSPDLQPIEEFILHAYTFEYKHA